VTGAVTGAGAAATESEDRPAHRIVAAAGAMH